MTVRNVRFQWFNLDSWRREVDRVTNTYEIVGVFEGVIAEQFALAQSQVSTSVDPHTDTYVPRNRLFDSGHTSTDFDGQEWTGEVIYDATRTDSDPTIYAFYEMNRGGVHDWLRGLEEMGDGPSGYIGALEAHFDGR